jgi:NAD(P)H-nitrite reductase large subunit
MEDKDIIICRCEDLSREDVRKLIAAGYTTVEEIKRISRCGMGPCQGRTCQQLLAREIAAMTGKDVADIAPGKTRPPATGVKLGALAKGRDDHE